eukprot:CAMPEP_0114572222 /NCGR_PEP_ID=MMETSP0114-20121206/18170_1 /TAXON_ID=31324 /ORGANISM="Goniomonas sp, Strain m" /LENGTH=581 /DNA_ID=CAMNT_0001759405 /DNA_START=12 /DNA_END=1754 /DNA_ORIENTATION=-
MGFAWWLVVLGFGLAEGVTVPAGNAAFACNYTRWNEYLRTSPDNWAAMSGDSSVRLSTSAPPTCRHCWWNLEFPPANPLVYASPSLNCSQFIHELFFDPRFGASPAGVMSIENFFKLFFDDYALQRMPNPFLRKKGYMIPELVGRIVDLNKDGSISLDEFLVVMHFWSPLIFSRSGPTLKSNTEVQGGLFFDVGSWAVWLEQSIQLAMTTEDYPPEQKRGWSLKLRQPRPGESTGSFQSLDFDSSRHYTLEEHYFGLWADQNGDNKLSAAEFQASLYYNPSIDNQFLKHDLNKDGFISRIERGFYAADTDSNQKLDKHEWEVGDFPVNKFVDNNLDSVKELAAKQKEQIDVGEFIKYIAYHRCTTAPPGKVVFWADECVLQPFALGKPPYLETVRGHDGHWEGFNARIWVDALLTNKWSSVDIIHVDTAAAMEAKLQAEHDKSVARHDHQNLSVAILSSADPRFDTNKYICSDSFGDDDGHAVMVLRYPPEVSLETATVQILISGSFLRFMCLCFFATFVMGHIFWFFERRRNKQFHHNYVKGVMDGLYFSLVTLTTVGYGDKSPVTGTGRVFTTLWMLMG